MEEKQKILVVDDDANIVNLLKEVLVSEGFEVLASTNGEEGLALFQAKHPDLIILDGLLPRINGFEITKRIRATDAGKQTPIVLVSGVFKSMKVFEQVRELEINHFVEKPFDLNDLVSKVKQLVQVDIVTASTPDKFEHKGDISKFPVPRLLYTIYRRHETGALYLAREKMKKKITFVKGDPLYIESNMVQECLGRLLAKKGRLSNDQVDESLRKMQTTKIRQGETLIAMGLITPAELDEALKEQTVEKMLDLFSWEDGQYRFAPGEDGKKTLTPLAVPLPQLVLKGVRNGFSLERLKHELDQNLDRIIVKKDNPHLKFAEFRLPTWDERILHEINGDITLRKLLKSKNAREQDVYQLISVFLATDMIEFVESAEDKKSKNYYHKVTQILDSMKNQDYFAILGVSNNSTPDEVSNAFNKKMQVYSPQSAEFNPTRSIEVGNVLTDISQMLILAKQTLMNEKMRTAYEKELFYTKGTLPANPSKIFDATAEFKKIKLEIDRTNFEKVEPILKSFASLFAKDWRFQVYSVWVQFKLAARKKDGGVAEIKQLLTKMADAIRLDQTEPDGFLFLGYMYKQIEDHNNAKAFFKKALDVDDNCFEAEREMRLYQMKDDKKSKSFIKWK